MDYNLGFKGLYIAAIELGKAEPTLTIASIKLEPVQEMDSDRVRDRWVIRFKEREGRAWIVNKTNAILMEGLCKSKDTDVWVGHRITLCMTLVQCGKQRVPGIRIKGSPELKEPLTVTVKLPRKMAVEVTLVPTGKQP